MPTFNISVTVSPRVAKLIQEYLIRFQLEGEEQLSIQDRFEKRVKELAREFARGEYSLQKREGPPDPVPNELSDEVT